MEAPPPDERRLPCDTVLALPLDARHLTLARVSDGARLIDQRPRAATNYILGVVHGRIALSGNEELGFYEVHSKDHQLSFDCTSTQRFTGYMEDGRGVICGEHVFVPGTHKLFDSSFSDEKLRALAWSDIPVKSALRHEVGGAPGGRPRRRWWPVLQRRAVHAHLYQDK